MRLKNILLLEPFNLPLTLAERDKKIDSYKKLTLYGSTLVYKRCKFRAASVHSLPLGLAQISSILKQEGISTDHIPFILKSIYHKLPDGEIERKIRSYDYDEVWISIGAPPLAHEALRFARIVKNINKDTRVMLGGIMPSVYPEFLMKSDEVDLIVRGPAESAVKQYVRDHSKENYKRIKGLCYKSKGKINIAPTYAQDPDLNKVPPFDFEGMCIDEYMKSNHYCNFQTSRGCPYNCPFCSHTKFWGLKVNYRPIKNIQIELKTLQEHGCKAGYLVDSAFTLNKDHLRRVVKVFEEEEINIKFWFETRADHFSDDIAALVSKIDPFLVWLGGESGSTKILRNLRGKNAKGGKKHLKDLRRALRNCKKYNLLCGSSWVLGLPGETMETIQETRKVIFELTKAGMDLAGIYILQIYPGTDYYKNPEKYGLKVIEKENFKSALWSEYAGHHTEGLTSKQILREATKLADELFEYYLEQSDYNKNKKSKKASEVKV